MTSVKWTDVIDSDKARRERIATAAMQGMLQQFSHMPNETLARQAVALADALIAELDKEKP